MTPQMQSTVELLDRLVAFDTTSHLSNRACIDFVADYLRGIEIEPVILPDATGEKANLFATIWGMDAHGLALSNGGGGSSNSAELAGGVCLSGHVDVVPVNGQAWTSDPFTLTQRGTRLYGRGTTDMKGFVACALAAVPNFQRAKLKTPIHIALSHDEEIGCVGVRAIADRLGQDLPLPKAVFVGEPTGMEVVDAHKGPARWKLSVVGRAAHSSMAHQGVNAISYMARVMRALDGLGCELAEGERDARFVPAYNSLQVTTVEGGTAANIIPVQCDIGFEIRALPNFDVDSFEAQLRATVLDPMAAEMRALAPETDVRLQRINHVPAFAATPGSNAVALALQFSGHNQTHAVSYATEAGVFQSAAAPAVVCGPGHIDQAHTADEFIEVSELEKCLAFLERLKAWAQSSAL
ncbi:MAG: acetylornithine deacetylase [Pseudomonadota bacterium]